MKMKIIKIKKLRKKNYQKIICQLSATVHVFKVGIFKIVYICKRKTSYLTTSKCLKKFLYSIIMMIYVLNEDQALIQTRMIQIKRLERVQHIESTQQCTNRRSVTLVCRIMEQ